MALTVQVEFSGGAELLADGVRNHTIDLPAKDKAWTVEDLLFHIRDNIIAERPELFMQDNSVRPGILVLINDTDWELLDEGAYEIQPNDKIVFISTLHGG